MPGKYPAYEDLDPISRVVCKQETLEKVLHHLERGEAEEAKAILSALLDPDHGKLRRRMEEIYRLMRDKDTDPDWREELAAEYRALREQEL